MENLAEQLFAEAQTALERQAGAPVVIVAYRWANWQWLRDEWRLMASGRFRPRPVARFGYRLLKLAYRTARRKAGGLKRRLARLVG
jgi:hypothetical protein